MSGYLRRLIDTAAARGDSVHPTTGSIFSPHQTEMGAPLQSAEEAESIAALRTPLVARTPAEPARPDEPRGVAPTTLPARLLPPAAAPITFSRPAAAPPPREMREATAEPALDFDEPSQRPVGARRAAEPDDEHTIPNRLPLARHDDDAPTPRDEADQASRSVVKPRAALDAFTRSESPRPKTQDPVARGAREPDEIQIHIGRIEVIAMQPPTPPRPSKAPTQSLTLDAFLNRRDGKSR